LSAAAGKQIRSNELFDPVCLKEDYALQRALPEQFAVSA
jgi:hypothetical protein